jgi:flavorubredoxin
MKAIVLFDTLFGNTEKIANSLVKGLQDEGIGADCMSIITADIDKIVSYDFIALGAPTQFETASRPMKEFLERLKDLDLKSKYGFAFDTRLDDIMAGSAAEYIEKKLETYGLKILRPYKSATVIWQEEKSEGQEGSKTQANLENRMETLFEETGREIGRLLQHKEKKQE